MLGKLAGTPALQQVTDTLPYQLQALQHITGVKGTVKGTTSKDSSPGVSHCWGYHGRQAEGPVVHFVSALTLANNIFAGQETLKAL